MQIVARLACQPSGERLSGHAMPDAAPVMAPGELSKLPAKMCCDPMPMGVLDVTEEFVHSGVVVRFNLAIIPRSHRW